MINKQSPVRQPATSESDERLITLTERCECQREPEPLTSRQRVAEVANTAAILLLSLIIAALAVIGGGVVTLFAMAMWA